MSVAQCCRKTANSPEKIIREINAIKHIIQKLTLTCESRSRYDLVAHGVCGIKKSTLYSFWQKFRESNSFTKEIAK